MPSESYLDLNTIVKDWAEGEYDGIANKKQKKLKQKHDRTKSHLNMTIDWADLTCTDHTIKFPVFGGKTDKHDKGKQPDANANAAAGDQLDASPVHTGFSGSSKPTLSVLFQTNFKNKTDRVQEYTMKTEKTTKSVFMVETESGYTKGIDMSVTLKTPCEIMEVNAGYHREYSLTKTSGQEFEEELNWGVESVIKVNKHHVAQAELVVFEEKKSGEFEIETEISGRVYVNFTNLRDNNSFVLSVSDDIDRIVKDYIKSSRKSMTFVSIDGRIVRVKTTGKCGFQYGIRQEVLVEQSPLDTYKPEEDKHQESDED